MQSCKQFEREGIDYIVMTMDPFDSAGHSLAFPQSNKMEWNAVADRAYREDKTPTLLKIFADMEHFHLSIVHQSSNEFDWDAGECQLYLCH